MEKLESENPELRIIESVKLMNDISLTNAFKWLL